MERLLQKQKLFFLNFLKKRALDEPTTANESNEHESDDAVFEEAIKTQFVPNAIEQLAEKQKKETKIISDELAEMREKLKDSYLRKEWKG